MIEVTGKASEAVKKVMEERSLEGSLRVFLNAGGCGGPSLAMAIDEAHDDDLTFDVAGMSYVISRELDEKSGGVTIDYMDQGYATGFSITPAKDLGFEGAACGGGCSGCG